MLFYLIALCLVTYSFINYRKAFYGYIIFRFVLVSNITIISMPGVPLLTIEVFLSIFFVALFYVYRKKLRVDKSSFPFKKPFFFIAVSWTISTIFAIAGFGNAFSQFFRDFCQDIILIYIMWQLIKEEKDFTLLFNAFFAVIFLSCIYGIYEGFIESNPLSDYEMSLNTDEARTINFDYSNDEARGYRIKSFFEHAIGAGMIWAITIFSIILLWSKRIINHKEKPFAIVLLLLCLLCLLLTKCRGPILFLLISCQSFVRLKSKNFYTVILIGVFILAIGWNYLGQFADNFLALFSSSAQERVGGSNAEMRFEQLTAAFLLLQISPIWGLGFKYMTVMDNVLTESLLGLESVWYKILPEFGILGIISNFILVFYSICIIPHKYRSKELFFFALAYWVVASMTSTPGLKMYYYYFVVFYLIKHRKMICKQKS